MDLTDATALVTGANRGIGRAVVEALADRPVRLVLAGVRDPDTWKPVYGRAEVRPVRLDLSSRAGIDEGCDALGEELGRIDLLVNNAGLMTGGLLEEQDMDAVYAMFQVNLVAVAHLTQPRAAGDGRARSRHRRQQRVDERLRRVPRREHVRGGEDRGRRVQRVAAARAARDRRRGAPPDHARRADTACSTPPRTVYGRHMDTSSWDDVEPEEWAAKALHAVERDDRVLARAARPGSRCSPRAGPAFLLDRVSARMFSRRPR